MASLDVGVHVLARDSLGLFFREIDDAVYKTLLETTEGARDVARGMVPKKTSALFNSIHAVEIEPHHWGVTAGTDHWRYVDRGTRAHDITGNVSFFWEKKGRWWSRGTNTIKHPGAPAVHFMAAAREYTRREFMNAAKRNFR